MDNNRRGIASFSDRAIQINMIESGNKSVFAVIVEAISAVVAPSTRVDVGSNSHRIPHFEAMDAQPYCFHYSYNLMSFQSTIPSDITKTKTKTKQYQTKRCDDLS